ncbi:hypothetical protein GF386_05315 [Candidatus Pacearchaeota archaeon]|nr:hypothetical protein [Candidatus Pacearchaeota archaeon]
MIERRKKRPVRIWVDPKFKTKLKNLANERDMPLSEFTKRISQEDDFFRTKKKEKKFSDVFKI